MTSAWDVSLTEHTIRMVLLLLRVHSSELFQPLLRDEFGILWGVWITDSRFESGDNMRRVLLMCYICIWEQGEHNKASALQDAEAMVRSMMKRRRCCILRCGGFTAFCHGNLYVSSCGMIHGWRCEYSGETAFGWRELPVTFKAGWRIQHSTVYLSTTSRSPLRYSSSALSSLLRFSPPSSSTFWHRQMMIAASGSGHASWWSQSLPSPRASPRWNLDATRVTRSVGAIPCISVKSRSWKIINHFKYLDIHHDSVCIKAIVGITKHKRQVNNQWQRVDSGGLEQDLQDPKVGTDTRNTQDTIHDECRA